MPYIRIKLTGHPVTKDQERELLRRTIDVMANRTRKDSDGVLVSIEQHCGSRALWQQDNPEKVDVHISAQSIAASDSRIAAKTAWTEARFLLVP